MKTEIAVEWIVFCYFAMSFRFVFIPSEDIIAQINVAVLIEIVHYSFFLKSDTEQLSTELKHKHAMIFLGC